ncbi:hypothetical protein Tco_0908485 [Tanacetum coccineum]|uniref:Uncharacterized protein n=1 Tax=Tanacetum coccineum TaxID=301880 RepID=A0ABQ5CND9_9ASTR
MELEPEVYIIGLHYSSSIPEGVKFLENMVIEEPEFNLFFIDEFNDPTFHRVTDIHKLMDEMIAERPDKHTLTSKKTNLERMGFKED